jgi:hypothetical protein
MSQDSTLHQPLTAPPPARQPANASSSNRGSYPPQTSRQPACYDKMLAQELRVQLEAACCFFVNDEIEQGKDPLVDDGLAVAWPTRVGSSLLFYGKKKSKFPFHCMAGPDWPLAMGVYFLIIIVNTGVLALISPLGWPPVLIGIFAALCLLVAFSVVACSDPGIIYKNDYKLPEFPDEEEGGVIVAGADGVFRNGK